mmetsp:Transcript_67241/g.216976  ORF Transcript_67241/g.216976 Transcript_67241/m.216976 type:complete len:590 (+) Transcript_67241:45-1814(+)
MPPSTSRSSSDLRRSESRERVRKSEAPSSEHLITRDSLGYELRLVMREVQDTLAKRLQQEISKELSNELLKFEQDLRQFREEDRKRGSFRPGLQRSCSNLSPNSFGPGPGVTWNDAAKTIFVRQSSGSTHHSHEDPAQSGYSKMADGGGHRSSLTELPLEHVVEALFDEEPEQGEEGQEQNGSSCRGLVAGCVGAMWFSHLTSFCIVVNAVCIGVQTEYMSEQSLERSPLVFRTTEFVFAVLFTLEILMRLFAFGCSFFTMPGWKWNVFDCAVVGMQIVEEVLHHLAALPYLSVTLNFAALRTLRVLRLIRIIRLVRVLRLVAELRRIVFSLAASLRPFCVTFVLLLMVIYITAVWLTQLVLDHRVNHDEHTQSFIALQYHFHSLGRTSLTLFEAVAGGLSWDSAVAPLIDEISPLMGLVFPLFIAFTVFACGNVITGVFVESLLNNAKETNDMYTLDNIREIFMTADADNSGTVSWEEFQEHLHEARMEELFKELDLHISQAEGMFRLLDVKGEGEVDMEEFCRGCLRLRGPAKAVDLGLLMEEVRRATGPLLQCSSVIEAYIGSSPASVVPSSVRQSVVSEPVLGGP